MTLRAIRGRAGDAAVVLCALACLARSSVRVASASQAAVDLLPREVALGTVPEGEDRLIRLVATNAGNVPVDASVAPSCTCMTLEPGLLRLAPRSHAAVPVRVSTARKPGFNVAHVQLVSASGSVLAQSRITFTAVQALVLDPPVVFLAAGEESVTARAYCLARTGPRGVAAESDDPAVIATVRRAGRRAFEIAVSLAGRPRGRLASVRIRETGLAGDAVAGTLVVSVPSSRIGDVRMAPVAEEVPGGRARAWMLVDAGWRCELGVRGLRAREGAGPSWRAEPGTTEAGSHLWIELEYPRTAAGGIVEVDLAAGEVSDRVAAVLPEAAGR